MTHADAVRCIELFDNEVLPALRAGQPSHCRRAQLTAWAVEHDLTSPRA